MHFEYWTASPDVKFGDIYAANTYFIMPANPVTVTANYGTKYRVSFVGAGIGAHGPGFYAAGETVNIYPGSVRDFGFGFWRSDPPVSFANAYQGITSFTMPSGNVTLTPIFTTKRGPVSYKLTVINSAGTKDYSCSPGSIVNISAGIAPAGTLFKNWTGPGGVNFDDPKSANTSFIMPDSDVLAVKANFEKAYTVVVKSEGIGAFGSGTYLPGESVMFYAGTHPNGLPFSLWEMNHSGITVYLSIPSISALVMLNSNTTYTAHFGSGASITIPAKTYTLTVENGKGSGKYEKGAQISIKANKAPAGKVFDKWVTSNGGKFADKKSASTTFTMPGKAVTVTATYKNKK